jgi:cell division septation protein DedD
MPRNDSFDSNDGGLFRKLKRFRKPLSLIGFVLIIGFVWYSYSSSGDNKSAQIPIIYAEKGEYKIKPENPGGLQIPHEDSAVFNGMRGTNDWESFDPDAIDDSGADEELYQASTETENDNGSVKVSVQDSENTKKVENLFDTLSEKSGPDIAADDTPEPDLDSIPQPEALAKPTTEAKEETKKDIDDVIKAVAETKKTEVITEAKTETVKTEPEPTPAPEPTKEEKTPVKTTEETQTEGTHFIQLGSFRTQDAAKEGYANLIKKYGEDINKFGVRYVDVTIEGKGDFVRVQAGPTSKTQADQKCSRIKAKGGACYVVAK